VRGGEMPFPGEIKRHVPSPGWRDRFCQAGTPTPFLRGPHGTHPRAHAGGRGQPGRVSMPGPNGRR
jgi:hypothetical protein